MRTKVPHKQLTLVGILVLLNIVFNPTVGPRKFNFKEGEIAGYDVIAPYDFHIPKSEDELLDERSEIAMRIPPVFILDNTVAKNAAKRIANLEYFLDSLKGSASQESLVTLIQKDYAITGEIIKYLFNYGYRPTLKKANKVLNDIYAKGIVDRKNRTFHIISIASGDKDMIESIDELYSLAQAESIVDLNPRPEFQKLVKVFLTPNVTFSDSKTQERIDEVFVNVPKTKGQVLKGEIIVEKHKRVSRETIEKLSALEMTYVSIGSWQILLAIFLRNLFYLAIFFLLYRFNLLYRLNIFATRNFYFVMLLSAIFLVLGKITFETNTLYVLPIAFFTFLFALYFNLSTAIMMTLVFASLFGILFNSVPVFTYLMVSGLVASFSSQTIRTRLSLYRPLVYIGLANVISIIFIDSYLQKGGMTLIHISEGMLNSVISSVTVILFLPLFEKLFDFTTDLTLLELGNLNLPIFKEMSINAPGTYHHSVVVGNLAEAGATAVSADPILARVGAYYHDIGKMKKPEYYIENQLGQKNPHDNLRPRMSALLIISHVKDGIDMAKGMKLPNRLVSIIAEHHGSSRIETFYRKSLHAAEGAGEDAFNYPGPRPKTKEAALVMLADGVEATARAEKNITMAKLQKILKDNFDKKFSDGQLDDCPLNRYDLEQIKTAFLPILTGIFHPRVEYEEAAKGS